MLFKLGSFTVFKNHLHKYAADSLPYRGANRRATSLLPQPTIDSAILLQGAFINARSNILLSLEANQQSGCLIIHNEINKSRAGILMYRGRILGCLRGQKRTGDYEFGNPAYERTLVDLAGTSQTDIYDMKDEVVAAAGALFHGQMQEHSAERAEKSFEDELNELVQSKLPGCIVISDKVPKDTYIVYVFAGEIVGIHSHKQGWLKPKVNIVRKYIQSCKNPRVQSCSMPCEDSEGFKQYSFSLSGLADRDFNASQFAPN